MKIKKITDFLENWAHPSLQEPYDNSGLILGDKNEDCQSALITLDVTEMVIDEAIELGTGLIIAHHPLIFRGIKKIGTKHWIDRCIRKAIKNDIGIYAIHTNLDNIYSGVNAKICEVLGLTKTKPLISKPSTLSKLTVFVPENDKEKVLSSLFDAGAGNIGNYDQCSFQIEGTGTFRGNDESNPTVGQKGAKESVDETRIEALVRKQDTSKAIKAMKEAHPYEEVAYYLSDLINTNQEIGSGMVGQLRNEIGVVEFLSQLKSKMNLSVIRHTNLVKNSISRVAVCGGSGSFLLGAAKSKNADIFITSDFKYHEFFEANDDIIIADIGHYESEVFTKDLLHDELSKTFANFAFHLSKVDTNPIKYL